ncbi:MAG: UxaA family hydrolase [Halobacteriaceae archaeon]
MTTRVPSAEGAAFAGVERDDGTVGVRDRVLVLPSVICSHVVADRIADRVEGAVSTPHDHGCGQAGEDNAQTERTFLGLAQNPNVAGTLVVGLGCEHVQSDAVAARLREMAVPVREVAIQDAGGTEACLAAGVDAAEDLATARGTARRPAALGDLTVGVVVGDLDGSTVSRAAPLVGSMAQTVVEAGGRVVAAGTERLTTHPDGARAATSDAARPAMEALLERHRGEPPKSVRVANEAEGRPFEDVTADWGGLPVAEVLRYGERPSLDAGLAVVDAPSQYEEAASALVAAGAQVLVHVTADGVLTGHPLAPTVKVSGDAETVAVLPDAIDVDATAADPDALLGTVCRVADGDPSLDERHGLTGFAITRIGPSM